MGRRKRRTTRTTDNGQLRGIHSGEGRAPTRRATGAQRAGQRTGRLPAQSHEGPDGPRARRPVQERGKQDPVGRVPLRDQDDPSSRARAPGARLGTRRTLPHPVAGNGPGPARPGGCSTTNRRLRGAGSRRPVGDTRGDPRPGHNDPPGRRAAYPHPPRRHRRPSDAAPPPTAPAAASTPQGAGDSTQAANDVREAESRLLQVRLVHTALTRVRNEAAASLPSPDTDAAQGLAHSEGSGGDGPALPVRDPAASRGAAAILLVSRATLTEQHTAVRHLIARVSGNPTTTYSTGAHPALLRSGAPADPGAGQDRDRPTRLRTVKFTVTAVALIAVVIGAVVVTTLGLRNHEPSGAAAQAQGKTPETTAAVPSSSPSPTPSPSPTAFREPSATPPARSPSPSRPPSRPGAPSPSPTTTSAPGKANLSNPANKPLHSAGSCCVKTRWEPRSPTY